VRNKLRVVCHTVRRFRNGQIDVEPNDAVLTNGPIF
jgi:hypothetical protein